MPPVAQAFYVRGAYLLFALLAALVLYTFPRYGISWDENVQDIYGKQLLSYYLSGFRDLSAFGFINLRYYGGAFDLLAAIVNLISPWGEYETRHLLGGLLGVLGYVGAWRLTRLLAGDRAALIVLVLLALTPLLYGHNMMNPKDAPFAWAMVWATFYLCRLALELPMPRTATLVGLAISIGLAIGSRVGGVLVLFDGLSLLLAYVIQRKWLLHQAVAQDVLTLVKRLWLVALIAIPLILLCWPWVAQAPGNLWVALKMFAQFKWDGKVLWDGQWYPDGSLPVAYLPVLLLLQLPEIVLLGLLLAPVLLASYWYRNKMAALTQPHALAYGVLMVTLVGPLADYFLLHPPIYNGIRHFLFIIPPLIICAGIALERAYLWLHQRRHEAALLGVVVFGALVVRQASAIVELYPDEYVYYNSLVGGLRGANNRFELDYWGVSLHEAADELEAYVEHHHAQRSDRKLLIYVCGDWLSGAYFFPSYMQYVGTPKVADFAIGIENESCRNELINSTPLFSIKRQGVPLSFGVDLRAQNYPDSATSAR